MEANPQGTIMLVHPSPFVNYLDKVKYSSQKEAHAPCPFCGGEDRFIVFSDTNRAWCRQCNWKGDLIQLLRDREGISYREACRRLGREPHLRIVPRQGDPHQEAIRTARGVFEQWTDDTARRLHEQRRVLEEQRQVCEFAYGLIHRNRRLFTKEEFDWWARKLATVYDRLAAICTHLDLLVDNDEIRNRFDWWRVEGEVSHA